MNNNIANAQSAFSQHMRTAATLSLNVLSASAIQGNGFHLLGAAAIGAAATGGANQLWNRFMARGEVDPNKQLSTSYVVPWRDGYLLVQPGRHWVKTGPRRKDDLEDGTIKEVFGYYATNQMARQQSHVLGFWIEKTLTTHETSPHLQELVRMSQEIAERCQLDLQIHTTIPLTPWQVIGDDSRGFVAFRRMGTVDGTRREFYPDPPAVISNVREIKEELSQRFRSEVDDDLAIPPTSPFSSEDEVAWRAQALPWERVPIDSADPHSAQRWVAVQRNPDTGAAVAWCSPGGRALYDRDLEEHLGPQLSPKTPWPPAVVDNPQHWRLQWQGRAIAEQGFNWGPTVPLAATDSQRTAIGRVPHETWVAWPLSDDTDTEWIIGRVQRADSAIHLQALRDPVHPTRLWRVPDPVEAGSALHRAITPLTEPLSARRFGALSGTHEVAERVVMPTATVAPRL